MCAGSASGCPRPVLMYRSCWAPTRAQSVRDALKVDFPLTSAHLYLLYIRIKYSSRACSAGELLLRQLGCLDMLGALFYSRACGAARGCAPTDR